MTDKNKDKGVKQEKEKVVEKTESNKEKEKEASSKNFLKKLVDKYKSLRMRSKIMIWGTVSVLGIIAIAIPVVLLLKLDSIVFPSTLEGQIYDFEKAPIESAKICISGRCTESDGEGEYKLEGLVYGKNNVKITLDGFEDVEKTIDLKRGTNTQNFELKVAGRRDFAGMLQLSDPRDNVIKEDLRLNLGQTSEDIILHDDGSFELKNVEVSTDTVEVQSPNYKDVEIEIDLSQLSIDLGILTLEPAGDIVFDCADWLSAETLDDIKISGAIGDDEKDNIDFDQEDVNCRVKDLAIESAVALEVSKDGYLTKSMSVDSITQGNNTQSGFLMIPEGKVVYTSNKLGKSNIYISNYDGSEEEVLTDNKSDNSDPQYDKEAGIIYFLSDRAEVEGDWGGYINHVYKLNVKTKAVTKISQNDYEEGGLGNYNLLGGTRAYTDREYDYTEWKYRDDLNVGNIDGTDTKWIDHSFEDIGSIRLSDDGKYVMYVKETDEEYEVYLHNLKSAASSVIYKGENYPGDLKFSPDGRKALMSIYDQEGGQHNLWLRDFEKGKLSQLTDNSAYEISSGFGPGSENVFYVIDVDSESVLFMQDLDGGEPQRIYTSRDCFSYGWADEYLYIYLDDGVEIINPYNPVRTQTLDIKWRVPGRMYACYY